jgi:hypothetical protein
MLSIPSEQLLKNLAALLNWLSMFSILTGANAFSLV